MSSLPKESAIVSGRFLSNRPLPIRKFNLVRQRNQETWHHAKAAVESAAAEVDKAYDNAKSKFKN